MKEIRPRAFKSNQHAPTPGFILLHSRASRDFLLCEATCPVVFCSRSPRKPLGGRLRQDLNQNISPNSLPVTYKSNLWNQLSTSLGFPGGSVVQNSPANAGDVDLIPGWRRSPGERNDSPFQYSCLGNPMNKGAWRATVHGVAKSQLQLSDYPTTPRCLHVPKFHTPEHLSFQKKCAHTHIHASRHTHTSKRWRDQEAFLPFS